MAKTVMGSHKGSLRPKMRALMGLLWMRWLPMPWDESLSGSLDSTKEKGRNNPQLHTVI